MKSSPGCYLSDLLQLLIRQPRLRVAPAHNSKDRRAGSKGWDESRRASHMQGKEMLLPKRTDAPSTLPLLAASHRSAADAPIAPPPFDQTLFAYGVSVMQTRTAIEAAGLLSSLCSMTIFKTTSTRVYGGPLHHC